MTCYKCGRASHYSRDCTFDDKKCYKCGCNWNFLKNCRKKNEAARLNVLPKAKARAYDMILDEETKGWEFGAACQEYLKEGDK